VPEAVGGAALASAKILAEHGATGAADGLRHVASTGFLSGLHTGCFVLAGVCVAGAIVCTLVLPSQPPGSSRETAPNREGAPLLEASAPGRPGHEGRVAQAPRGLYFRQVAAAVLACRFATRIATMRVPSAPRNHLSATAEHAIVTVAVEENVAVTSVLT